MQKYKSNKFGQIQFASFALAITVALISTTASAQPASSPPPTQTPQPSQQATDTEPKEGEWRTISPSDALATFSAPKKPRYIERTFTPVANKPPIKVHLYMSPINKGKENYIFGYHDLHEIPGNARARDRAIEGAVRGSIINVQGKLLSDVDTIRFKKWPGRQFNYQYLQNEKNFVVLSRVFLVEKRLYQLNAIALESEFDKEIANKFLNSFKLVTIENDEPPVPRIPKFPRSRR